tara:strand:+ start:3005 stop:3718 length:714 start_codon:yes stop_codon:yes gene_type:complete
MFGKYKQSITTTLVSSYATNKKLFKESFHNLMGGLRENKIAREFFVLYGEIENKRFDDKKLAEEYLNTVINTLKSKKKNLRIPVIKELSESFLNKIYSKLDSLIFNESVMSLEKNILNKRKLIEHLTREETGFKITETVSTSILSTLATTKFNKKYESLSEEDKKDLKKYMGINKKTLKSEFDISKKEVVEKLNSLKESSEDKEMLSKLNSVISQIDSQNLDGVSLYKLDKLKEELK